MNPRVIHVRAKPDYLLELTFSNGEIRLFNMKPYLEVGVFKELQDPSVFNSVKSVLGSVQWQNGQDLCPDTLYLDSAGV
jgi:hypothetical protein